MQLAARQAPWSGPHKVCQDEHMPVTMHTSRAQAAGGRLRATAAASQMRAGEGLGAHRVVGDAAGQLVHQGRNDCAGDGPRPEHPLVGEVSCAASDVSAAAADRTSPGCTQTRPQSCQQCSQGKPQCPPRSCNPVCGVCASCIRVVHALPGHAGAHLRSAPARRSERG